METLEITPNRQILARQTELLKENDRLRNDILKLTEDFAKYKETTVDLTKYNDLEKRKCELLTTNQNITNKLKRLQGIPPPPSKVSTELEKKDKETVDNVLKNLHNFLISMQSSMIHIDIDNCSNTISSTVKGLTKTIEQEEQKCVEAEFKLKQLKNNKEELLLKDKLYDMQSRVADLQLTNSNLKENNKKLIDEIKKLQQQFNMTEEQIKLKNQNYEDVNKEITLLRQKIDEIENCCLKLKKELIIELEEATKARKIAMDSEQMLKKYRQDCKGNE